ncbi:MAG: arsenite methyltransferase [Chloroflexi bacterium]|nr:MAG: arsenite methyltransferase [Chloroflexota bacterium]
MDTLPRPADLDRNEQIHTDVRAHYRGAALSVLGQAGGSPAEGSCCGPASGCGWAGGETTAFGPDLYDLAERGSLPDGAVLASLGCGNPTAVAELNPGETVLDLGSGGGIDVLLSAARVGTTGRAIGVDMTDEMIELSRRNARDAKAANVDFLKGTIEALPLPDASVDVVISNCVINLAADKPAVFAEIARVLRPGGRIGVSDVVARDDLGPGQRAERGSYAGCIAGALSFGEYEAGLRDVGLSDITVRPTHQVADGLFAAVIRARRPAGPSRQEA